MNVLEFIEKPPKEIPSVVSVERKQSGKYLVSLVIRFLSQRTGLRCSVISYEKGKMNEESARAIVEEFSIFEPRRLIFLQDFPSRMVKTLNPTPGTIVIAETDSGDLEIDKYSYQKKRDILKVLLKIMNLNLSLRELLKLDWSECRSFEDFEPVLAKAKLMGWSTKEIAEEAEKNYREGVLSLLKRGSYKEIHDLKTIYGKGWLHRFLIASVSDLALYRSLIRMGVPEDRISKEMGLSWRKKKEIEEATKMLSGAEIVTLASRIIEMDQLVKIRGEWAFDLLYMRSGISMR